MISKDSIYQAVEQFIVDTDYFLVDIKVTPDNRVMVEIDSFEGVKIDFCAELNRHIESQIDREIEDYDLEVGSAGLTEPFKVQKQYEKNLGNEVETLSIQQDLYWKLRNQRNLKEQNERYLSARTLPLRMMILKLQNI